MPTPAELWVALDNSLAQQRNRERENEALQTENRRLRGLSDALLAVRENLTRTPGTLEELRWQVLVGYGFTPQAAAICYSVDLGPLTDADAANYDGLSGPTFVRLGLGKPRLAALHEFLHVCWWRMDFDSSAPTIDAAMLRLVNGEGTPEQVMAGSGAWMRVEGMPVHHPWVYLGLWTAGDLSKLPDYLRFAYEGVFTGAPLL